MLTSVIDRRLCAQFNLKLKQIKFTTSNYGYGWVNLVEINHTSFVKPIMFLTLFIFWQKCCIFVGHDMIRADIKNLKSFREQVFETNIFPHKLSFSSFKPKYEPNTNIS